MHCREEVLCAIVLPVAQALVGSVCMNAAREAGDMLTGTIKEAAALLPLAGALPKVLGPLRMLQVM